MNQRILTILRWIPALAWMALIFWFSHQPGGDSGNLSKAVLEWFASIGMDLRTLFGDNAFLFIRKMAHFAEYFILYTWLYLAMGNYAENRWKILLVTVLYAASDEIHQLFIPGRVGDWVDVCIDSLGALAALGFWGIVHWFRSRQKRR